MFCVGNIYCLIQFLLQQAHNFDVNLFSRCMIIRTILECIMDIFYYTWLLVLGKLHNWAKVGKFDVYKT